MTMSRNSARIRVTREQAAFLEHMLAESRHRLVVRRADAKQRGEDLADYQLKIGTVTSIQQELQRAMDDMEWPA